MSRCFISLRSVRGALSWRSPRGSIVGASSRMSTWSGQTADHHVTTTDSCTGCAVPCQDAHHTPYTLPLPISTADMSGSVQRHLIHLLVCEPALREPAEWPNEVEGVDGSIVAEVLKVTALYKHVPIRVSSTATRTHGPMQSAPIHSSSGVDNSSAAAGEVPAPSESSPASIIAFPLHRRFDGVTRDNVADVVQRVLTMTDSTTNATISPPKSSNKSSAIMSELRGTYFLICSHTKRDPRCGVLGPILIEQILSEARQRGVADDVTALPISHIGGHKFAGNVIAYGDGSWYGRVTPCHAHVLLDAYINKDKSAMEKLQIIKRGGIQHE